METAVAKKREWIFWQAAPIVGVALVSVVKELVRVIRMGGLSGIRRFDLQLLGASLVWMAGSGVGWLMVDLDKYLGKYVSQTKVLAPYVEQWKRGIRNVLTAGALAILGLWAITSTGSPFAWGMIFGLQIRLFSEFVTEKDYKSWYWVFARDFSESENRTFILIWGAMLLLQVFMVVRG